MKSQLLTFSILCLMPLVAFSQWTMIQSNSGALLHTSASTENFLFFAGGQIAGLNPSNAVEIYSIEENLFFPDSLSIPRTLPAGVASGNQVFFAGGFSIITGINYDTIDIYHINTSTWSGARLSAPRSALSAVAVGDKVLFAGGGNVEALLVDFESSNVVDIYDTTNEIWTTATLSQPRMLIGATVVGNKAFFAGGAIDNETATNRVDIYDATTNTWSIDSLSSPRIWVAAATAGTKAIFAGGNDVLSNSYNTVDIYDTATETWSTTTLSQKRTGIAAAANCEKTYFLGGGDINWETKFLSNSFANVDIYDAVADTWTTELLEEKRASASAAAGGGVIIIHGGFNTSPGTLHDTGDLALCETTVAQHNIFISESTWSIASNPASKEGFFLHLESGFEELRNIEIYNSRGQLILETGPVQPRQQSVHIQSSNLSKGLHFIKIRTKGGQFGIKKVVLL